MSDRYLRTLLREAQQGQVPLHDYVAAALRAMPLEEVIDSLRGFDTESIRLAVRLVWIPAYAAQDEHTKARVALAGVLGDTIAKRVAPSRRYNDFLALEFFERNQSLLSDAEWRLFAADCAEHVLHHFETKYPDDDRPRKAIETARRFALGEASEEELHDAESAARAAALSAAESAARSAACYAAWDAARSAAESAARFDAGSAARSAASSATWFAARQAEIAWQAARLADYLVDLSALPPPPT